MSERMDGTNKSASGGRLELVDALRGLLLVNMIAYHLFYDLTVLFGLKMTWFWDWPGQLWQSLVAGSFILISGFSSRLSRKNGRRGLLLLGCGMLLSLVTWIVMPGQLIRFGVLHFLGTAALLWALLGRWLDRVPAGVLLGVGLLLFCLTWGTQNGFWGCGVLRLVSLPDSWYTSRWLFPLGFPGPNFYSADYFPLLPWFFLYLSGTAVQRLVAARPALLHRLKTRIPFFSVCGRHTLIVYLLHQPVLYGLCLALMQLW